MCQTLPTARPGNSATSCGTHWSPACAERHPASPEQAKVLRRLAACRTAFTWAAISTATCGFTRVSYNSCRDRHCPKCQAAKRAEWLETRLERLLPVPYFHVVFTVPDILYPLMLHNQRRLYDLLFRTASATLLTLAINPNQLGARIGITALLHTWGQNLLFHPHLAASLPAAACRRTGNTGWPASPTSSCRSRCWANCSAASSSPTSRKPTKPAC